MGNSFHIREMRSLITVFCAIWFMWGQALADTIHILALGDSLTAGYGLDPGKSFADKLQEAMKAKGHDVVIINGGVSGDTIAQGAARLEWALTDDVKAVIVELGANDALRGLDPAQAETSLRQILGTLKKKKLPTLVAGMVSPSNMGADYQAKFNPIYPKLASEFGVELYPFFLEGVATKTELNQPDGIHPNEKGVAQIVSRIVPYVEKLVTNLP
jgi:acyl-CoA thioesterase I